jgi:hypothetical protein
MFLCDYDYGRSTSLSLRISLCVHTIEKSDVTLAFYPEHSGEGDFCVGLIQRSVLQLF